MPLSSQLQQHWQTVVDRLPADFPVSTLSERAQSVMAFSDFVEQSLIAQPQWLAELESSPPEALEWHHYAEWLQVRLAEVNDEAALMRELRQAAAAGQQQARFAVDLYTHKARREVGALTACIGGLDVLEFTAGIGENDAQLRHDVCHGLSYLGVALDDNANQAANGQLCPIHSADSRVEIWVCPTDEGKNAAEQAWALLHA